MSQPGTEPKPKARTLQFEMQLAKVLGDIVCTRKDENLTSLKLLVIQPLAPDGMAAGRTLVAVDSVGAGVGETVFFVRGKEASFPFYPVEAPVDAGIVGIVDHYDVEGGVPGREALRVR